MHTEHPCLECMFNQGERTARRLLGEGKEYEKVIQSLRKLVDRQPPEGPPPAFFKQVYALVSSAAGEDDPFREQKRQNTEAALQLYPFLKSIIANSSDPLETAVRIAIAGNIIDHGGGNPSFDEQKELESTLKTRPQKMDYVEFQDALERAEQILYLGDNAGETVYDRVLIETIDKSTIFTVRDQPIINDVTMEDALQAGLDHAATLISTGLDMPGIVVEQASDQFQHAFEQSDMVISKGMGNFETLSDAKRLIFFLLKAKCDLVAEQLGVDLGDSVLFASNYHIKHVT